MAFYIKQNDTRPILTATLIDGDGSTVNLDGATVSFKMRTEGGTTAVSLAGTTAIAEAAKGKVTYTWAAADTATVGEYEGEFEVTYAGGGVQTFPNSKYIQIEITDDIA